MAQPSKELLDRKVPARILGHAGLSLLLSWVITSRILPRLQEQQFAGIILECTPGHADRSLLISARANQGCFLMRGLGNAERSRPMWVRVLG
jgi:hypothetical protein